MNFLWLYILFFVLFSSYLYSFLPMRLEILLLLYIIVDICDGSTFERV